VNAIEYKDIINFSSINDIEKYLMRVMSGSTLIVDLIGRNPVTLFIYKLLKKYGISYICICANSLPIASGGPSKCNLVDFKYWRKLASYFKSNIVRYFDGINFWHPTYAFAGGRMDTAALLPFRKKVKIVWAHTLDYDLYLDYMARVPAPILKQDYAVFLDENWPFHPDFFVNRTQRNDFKEPNDYYEELDILFSKLEKKNGVPIVIAAHPRSRYEDMPDLFSGRKVIKMNTINLVANAKYVLAHGSTSVNFAILFEKPLIFLMPAKVKAGFFEAFIKNFAKQFNKEPIEADKISNYKIGDELFVDKELYSNYKENYIKTKNSPENHFWDIVADAININ
jgi:hypothetical protein